MGQRAIAGGEGVMSEWFAMGGHGFYIWGSFGVSALFMVGEVILVMRRRRTLVERLGRMIRMNSSDNSTVSGVSQ